MIYSNYFRFGIMLPLFYLFTVYTAYYWEKNRSIYSIGDSYWYFLFAFITGVARFSPATFGGRAITLISSVVRICLYGTTLAKVSSLFINFQNQRDKRLRAKPFGASLKRQRNEHILRELAAENESQGLFLADIPAKFVGGLYEEFAKSLENKDILIGVLENTGNFYNRRQGAPRRSNKDLTLLYEALIDEVHGS